MTTGAQVQAVSPQIERVSYVLDFYTSSIDGGQSLNYLSFSDDKENEMKYQSLTLERLKEMVSYDQETGVFLWKQRPHANSRKREGDEAGSVKASGYRYINIDNHTYLCSQLAWFYVTGEWPRGRIGVKNKNQSDLSFDNLFQFNAAPGKHDQTTIEGRSKWRRAHKEAHPHAHRAYGWKRYYGIGAEDYQRMFAEQGGVCAICKRPERAKAPRTGETKWLSVDHCHATNAVRSLLCSHCNHTIGHVADDPEILEAAAAYLRLHKDKVN